MAKKDKFVIEFSPLTASQFNKNGVELNRSWADHVIGKTIKQLIPVLEQSIEANRQKTGKRFTSLSPREEGIAVIDMLLQRHHDFILKRVYQDSLTCKDLKKISST